jgi:hypothetical protein
MDPTAAAPPFSVRVRFLPSFTVFTVVARLVLASKAEEAKSRPAAIRDAVLSTRFSTGGAVSAYYLKNDSDLSMKNHLPDFVE